MRGIWVHVMTSFCCFGTYRDIFRVWLIQLGFNGCVWGMVWVISLTRPWPIPSGVSEPSHFDLDPGRAEGETCWRKLSSGRGRSSYFPQLFFQGKSTGKKTRSERKKADLQLWSPVDAPFDQSIDGLRMCQNSTLEC